jgi:hypothetical protein
VFCAQFFDPDFPDGIAYPVRVEAEVSDDKRINCLFEISQLILVILFLQKTSPGQKDVFSAIQSQSESKPLVPFYDTRYLANPIEVGEVLSRPATTDSRHRAKRVTQIAHEVERRLHIEPISPDKDK